LPCVIRRLYISVLKRRSIPKRSTNHPKLIFWLSFIKAEIVKIPNRKEVKNPIIAGNEKENAEVLRNMLAIRTTGSDMRKLSLKAVFPSNFFRRRSEIVIPEREIPGNKANP